MRFTVQHPIAVAGYTTELLRPGNLRSFARTAEAVGFDAIAFTDHPIPSHKWVLGGGHDGLDPATALGFCAAVTDDVRLMPYATVLPYRNPFLVAKAMASLDLISGGRVVLAAATGYLRSEFAALGVDFAERNVLFDEAIEVLRDCWTTPGLAYRGRGFEALGQSALPLPGRAIPLWIAGNSARARERAARHGQGWAPVQYSPAQAATTRTPPLESLAELLAAVLDLARRCESHGRDVADLEIQVESEQSRVLVDGRPLAEHAAHLEQLADLGVTGFVVDVPGSSANAALEGMHRYAEEVIAPMTARP